MNEKLFNKFREVFPDRKEVFLARAPGRLNIIGEHTDYSALPVLPFAANVSLKILFSPSSDNKIKLYSLNLPEQSPIEFKIEKEIPHSPPGDWANYVKAAVQDAVNYAEEMNVNPEKLKGFSGVVYSDIPLNAGLSSSSALVVASDLISFFCQGWELNKLKMAERTAKAEHYVGTMGGGMDQTTSICGKKNHCLKIYFYPLEISEYPINIDCSFVIANTLVHARKSSEVKNHYNQRVLECKLIKEIINCEFLREGIIPEPINYIGDLRKADNFKEKIRTWKKAISEILGKENYSLDEAKNIIGDKIFSENIYPRFSGIFKFMPEKFPLLKRAKYLFGEWERVEKAGDLIQKKSPEEIGDLIYRSHEGLKDYFEVSHPRADKLIDLAKNYGIQGARIVGAGFGGSTIHLVQQNDVSEYKEYLKREYYEKELKTEYDDSYIQVFSADNGAGISGI